MPVRCRQLAPLPAARQLKGSRRLPPLLLGGSLLSVLFREFHLDRSPANDLRCMDSRAGCVDGVKRHVRVAELPILPRRPLHFAPAVLLEVPAEVLGGDRPRNLAHEHPLARRRG